MILSKTPSMLMNHFKYKKEQVYKTEYNCPKFYKVSVHQKLMFVYKARKWKVNEVEGNKSWCKDDYETFAHTLLSASRRKWSCNFYCLNEKQNRRVSTQVRKMIVFRLWIKIHFSMNFHFSLEKWQTQKEMCDCSCFTWQLHPWWLLMQRQQRKQVRLQQLHCKSGQNWTPEKDYTFREHKIVGCSGGLWKFLSS